MKIIEIKLKKEKQQEGKKKINKEIYTGKKGQRKERKK